MEAGDGDILRHEMVQHEGRRWCYMETGESATWRREMVVCGGRIRGHVEAGYGGMWRQEMVAWRYKGPTHTWELFTCSERLSWS